MQEIKHSAISHSTENLFLQIDSMDNSKSYLPRYLEHAKEYQGTERLPTKITGGLIHSGCYQEKRKVMLFLNHEQVLFTNYGFFSGCLFLFFSMRMQVTWLLRSSIFY